MSAKIGNRSLCPHGGLQMMSESFASPQILKGLLDKLLRLQLQFKITSCYDQQTTMMFCPDLVTFKLWESQKLRGLRIDHCI